MSIFIQIIKHKSRNVIKQKLDKSTLAHTESHYMSYRVKPC